MVDQEVCDDKENKSGSHLETGGDQGIVRHKHIDQRQHKRQARISADIEKFIPRLPVKNARVESCTYGNRNLADKKQHRLIPVGFYQVWVPEALGNPEADNKADLHGDQIQKYEIPVFQETLHITPVQFGPSSPE